MPALHERRMLADTHNVRMRRAESGKTFVHHILDGIDQLLHPPLLREAYKKVLIEIFGQDSVRLMRDAATPFEVTTAERQYQR